ncbi:SH3 domain-containing protein [Sarocladium implicatum]|nr:SH3 domain-containing protein [Sarocladium implicatum]
MAATSPAATSPSQAANFAALSPLDTPDPLRRSSRQRPMSHASKARLSQYSTSSAPSRSRPTSHVFPMYPSSLPYALVRDFAYPINHPMHYGALPDPPSGMTTPASEHRRMSDPPAAWEQKMPWDSWTADGFGRGHDIPPIQFGDGPPYSEDEDLQSPVVATRHRKHKSTSAALGRVGSRGDEGHMLSAAHYDPDRGYFAGAASDGSERYYVGQGGEANGPGGDFVTYPPGEARRSRAYHYSRQPHGGGEHRPGSEPSSRPSSRGYDDQDESRYSRDYQFTITSPDEEFHGKAVALFDFVRENENELPLAEGQIIWVSYRHGQGWLVAEDPKTQESGLVPEEYVRLLRDIQGGMNSLTGLSESDDIGTPTQPEHAQVASQPAQSTAANGYHQPVVSSFSTSSKDLNPYPTGQLGLPAGQAPPQVIHYQGQKGGSQANTPTVPLHTGSNIRRGSDDGSDAANITPTETSTGAKESETVGKDP